MTNGEHFKERYRSGETPWDTGVPDFNLIEVVKDFPVQNCKALEIGCGTGDNAIWLAQNRFEVTGLDISDIAVGKATGKASQVGAKCRFLCADFLQDKIDGAPFGFMFDRGCFHSFGTADDRRRCAANAAAHLGDAGLWLSLVGNADEVRQGPGPPQRSAQDIVLAVEPFFEILLLRSGRFGSSQPNGPRAWRCLMRKRST